MTSTRLLVDTNVLLDVVNKDPTWWPWSAPQLSRAIESGRAVTNAIIYAEFAGRYRTQAEVDVLLSETNFLREHIPFEAAFLAGQAHARYRAAGGARTTTLPDFFIGAHAVVAGHRLLTRDARRYRAYFPEIDLIAPN